MVLRLVAPVLSLALLACDASTTTVLGPTPPKCAVSAAAEPRSFGAAGGSGALSVTTERECSWTVSTEAGWLSLPSNRQGQGPSTLSYTVSRNDSPVARSAAITVNDTRVEVAQQAAECTFAVTPSSLEIGTGGGDADLRVETVTGCSWEARSLAGWIFIVSGAGASASATVRLRVSPNDGPERSGTVEVAGRAVTVRQFAVPAPPPGPAPGPTCSYGTSPPSITFPADGGVREVDVTAGTGCSWTALSSADWLRLIAGASGSGNGTFRVQAASNTATAERTGTISIGGDVVVEVTQQGETLSCSYDAQPRSFTVVSTGGVVRVQVNTQTGCTWTAVSQASWLTVTAGASGAGPGAVEVQVASNTTTSTRSGSAVIAGMTVVVNQSAPAPCVYAVSPTSLSFPEAGGEASIAVTTTAGCAWTAASGAAAWLNVVSGSSGSGNGTVRISAGRNPAAEPRSTAVLVAGHAIAVTQAAAPPPCSYGVQPLVFTVSPLGETVSVTVTALEACAWTASTSTSWLAVVSGGTDSGSGTVSIRAGLNPTSSQRTGAALVAGQTVSFTQIAGDIRTFDGRVSGLSGSCPSIRFTVDGVQILATSETTFSGGSCNSVGNGDRVDGEGILQNGTITAARIRRRN